MAVDGIELEEVDKYWELFCKTEKLDFKITESYKRNHFAGHVTSHRVGNVLFVGNAGGFMDPLLGFGIYPSIVSGYEAARAIAFGTDYEAGIKDILKLNDKLLEFRKMFSRLNNGAYDLLLRSLSLPGINELVYNTKLNVLDMGYKTIKPLNKLLDQLE